MKNILITLALMLTVGIGVSQAQREPYNDSQVPTVNSWALGLGFVYPRFCSVNITALSSDYGVYLSLQRNFSEHVGLRLKGSYYNIEGQWNDAAFNTHTETTNLMTGDLDVLYRLVPCEPVSPYLYGGLGEDYKIISNSQTPNSYNWNPQLNVGAGVEIKVVSNWRIDAEFGYHLTGNSSLDGTIVPGELNGRDSYMDLGIGATYLFGKGVPSKQCRRCCRNQTEIPGAKDLTDYNRIENMIVKHIPKEVANEAVTDRYILAFKDDKLVLVGVRFAFDKSDLLTESYELLDKSVVLLNAKPDAKFEVQGYTDYIGTDAYNQDLSVKRAQTVKAYLVTQGIAQNRLTCVGFGKNDPVEDNATAEGRAQNRRIVFKIIK
jgi:OOP family OmpA-OmpF porin